VYSQGRGFHRSIRHVSDIDHVARRRDGRYQIRPVFRTSIAGAGAVDADCKRLFAAVVAVVKVESENAEVLAYR
jgi:hypothetical protein